MCTVETIKARRLDRVNKTVEYLVSWKEYPGEDTWETIDNLRTVQHLLDAYEEKLKKA